MTDPPSDEAPIALDRVERVRGEGEDVCLRLRGRWLTDGPRSDPADALLVVQLQGRRHRFPATRAPSGAEPSPGNWQAEFTVPSWAVPDRPGQAAVWVGTSVIAVAPPGAVDQGDPAQPRASAAEPKGAASETVAALRGELDARASRQAALESAHGELRHQLEQLTAAVTRQRKDFEKRTAAAAGDLERAREQAAMAVAARDQAEAALLRAREQLATADIARAAAISEAAGLRAELERLGAELAVTREQVSADGGDLGEARSLLADARALTEQLREAAGS